MDDLNGDKRIDREDATVLLGMVVDVERSSRQLTGGLAQLFTATLRRS